jgi:hypothetical protein
VVWLGLMARDYGCRASALFSVRDEVAAFDFDRAITLRMLQRDNEKDRDNRAFWHKLVTGEDLPD